MGRSWQAGERARTILRASRDRVAEGRIPSWLLGTLIAILAWRPTFLPPTPGLDPSWHTGLAIALHRGLQFGTDVVFTFGPLGFLDYPGVWYQDLAVVSFCYSVALYVALSISLVWALRRTLSTWAAAVAAYLVLAVLPGIEQPVALAAILALGMLQRGPPPFGANGFVVVLASLAAVEALLKISVGPLILAMGLIVLVGIRARWWQIGGLIALFAAEVLLIWVVTGQDIANLPDFIRNGKEVVGGYNEAMSFRQSSSVGSLLTALLPLAIVPAAAVGRYRDPLARGAAIALAAVTAFVLFKHGVVRFGPNHLAIWASTACLVWIAIPWDVVQRGALVLGAAVLGAVAVHQLPSLQTGLDPIRSVKSAREQIENLVEPGRRAELEDAARASMQQYYGLEPQVLDRLRGHSVSVDPWEIGVVWAYDLEWSPLPVFQNYSAYTARLDELNADRIADPAGPERVLRQDTRLEPDYPTGSIDSRYPPWDPPGQALATLCNFVPLQTTDRWQVLGRRPDRCTSPQPAGSVDASFGDPVRVPAPGDHEVVFAEVHGAGIDGLERLWSLVWRPKSRYAVLNGQATYRVVPGTAADGLLLRADGGTAGRGPFAQTPQARMIELTGAGGDLRYDFFRMRVEPAKR